MNIMVGAMIAIVFIVVAANIFMILRRLRNAPRKTGEIAPDEEEAMSIRNQRIQFKLDLEFEEAERRVELRKKTWELFDQVRNRSEEEERGEMRDERA